MVLDWLRVLVALTISALLLFCSAFIRKLVRGTGFRLQDFYVASDILLAALTTEVIFSTHFASSDRMATNGILVFNGVMTAATVVVLLVVVSIHQSIEGRAVSPSTRLFKDLRFWVLNIFLNFIAVLVLGVSIVVGYGSLQ